MYAKRVPETDFGIFRKFWQFLSRTLLESRAFAQVGALLCAQLCDAEATHNAAVGTSDQRAFALPFDALHDRLTALEISTLDVDVFNRQRA